MSTYHDYACEGCQDLLAMTIQEYTNRVRRWNGKLLCDDCRHIANRHRRELRRKKNARNDTRPGFRDQAGVIVTAREQRTGNMWTLTRSGLAQVALQSACAALDAAEGDWRIVCICTPATILQDLQGGREVLWDGDRSPSVEAPLLGRIGRLDLLEDRVRAYARSA